ncbi:ATP dependent DNA ligase [Falsarthrobacter nasiphocae]|nr:hypothetical protein [Falsarthrobacter nasiphocae]
MEQDVIIVGWRAGRGARSRRIGSLLVAVPRGLELHYVGRVGTGFKDAELAQLTARLRHMTRKLPPTDNEIPTSDAKDAHWVRPALVGRVAYQGFSEHGRYLSPVWKGWLQDKTPSEVASLPGEEAH